MCLAGASGLKTYLQCRSWALEKPTWRPEKSNVCVQQAALGTLGTGEAGCLCSKNRHPSRCPGANMDQEGNTLPLTISLQYPLTVPAGKGKILKGLRSVSAE